MSLSASEYLSDTRENAWCVVGLPVLSIACLHAAHMGLAAAKIIDYGYVSPYLAIVAALSSRIGLRAGLIACVAAIPSYNFLIMPPLFQFNVPSLPEVTAYASMVAVAIATAPRSGFPEAAASPHPTELPFVSQGATPVFWSVADGSNLTASGRAYDDSVGAVYGEMYVASLRDPSRATPPLSWVGRDMILRGRYTGLEAGFLNALERAASGTPPDKNPDNLDLGGPILH